MKELYFISVLGGLKIGSLIIIGLACLIIFIIVLNISVGDINDEMVKYKKPAIYACYCVIHEYYYSVKEWSIYDIWNWRYN